MDIKTIITSAIIALGGSGGISFLLVKALGNKIIDSQFQKALENYKYQINSKFDRVSKIHEKEFTVLPIIWSNILSTNTELGNLTNPFQEYPDLARMNEKEIEEVFRKCDFTESEAKKIETAYDKQKEFISIYYWKRFYKANSALANYDKCFHENRIFLTKDLENNLFELRKIFIEIVSLLKYANYNNNLKQDMLDNANKAQEKANPIINEIALQIQKRLKFDEAL
jgi:hypothetical protein